MRCCAFCGLLWQRQRADAFQLQSHDLLLCVLRRPSLLLHGMLHAAEQHAVDRRAAAAYGDAYLLFGRPKMLISA